MCLCVVPEGTAYSFGPRGGLITYMIPRNKRPSTNRDTFALGLVTSQRDAVLFRVDSGNSKDYIEAELVRHKFKQSVIKN